MNRKRNLLLGISLGAGILMSACASSNQDTAVRTETGAESGAQNGTFLQTFTEGKEPVAESVTEVPSPAEEKASDGKEASGENTSEEKTSEEKSSTEKVDASEFTASISKTGSWGENPVFYQLSIRLTNASNKAVDGWTLAVKVGDQAAIDSAWSGTYSIDGGVLTVTPVEYTKIIQPGENVELGLIVSGVSEDLSYTLTCEGTVSGGSVSQGNAAGQNQNQNQTHHESGSPAVNALEVPEPTTDDWLHVKGTDIVDASGKKVWLTGVNWFGYNTGTNTFDGLWNSDLNNSIQGIANHGFNLIRVPISAELLLQWKEGKAPTANFNQATNYYLVGMDSLEIFDYVIGQCRANGLKIMMDIHSAETDASGHNVNLWTTDRISTAQYQEALVWLAERYKDDDTILAVDLKNEPHGKPGEDKKAIWNDSKDANNWKYVAEDTALKVLAKNPNLLILVEGTEIYPMDIKKNGSYASTDKEEYYFNWWGGNLRGVKDYPVDLGKYQSQLVYSPHDYGPTVYEQPWFKGKYDYDSLMKDCWEDNWFYIYEDEIAPLLIGEWGGYMTEPNITWMTYMRELIGKYHLNHTFWCFNANSGDTGGLVLDDFTTWDEKKYEFVKEVLWQENGKFVGLDHEIPLGTDGNGMTLSESKGLK